MVRGGTTSPLKQPSHPALPCASSSIGGEKVILLSASTWGFITVVTPLLAHLGSGHLAFMTFSRVLTGLLQGKVPCQLPPSGVAFLPATRKDGQSNMHTCVFVCYTLAQHSGLCSSDIYFV